MGMAASQARLLSLTNRLNDVEFKAQQLQAQKIALATQKDELYQRYSDALEATTINVAYWNNDGTTRMVQANYNSVCGYNENRCMQYGLQDNKTGLAIVPENIKNAYKEFGNDKYAFAWAALGLEDFNDPDNFTNSQESGMAIGYINGGGQDNYTLAGVPYSDGNVLHMTEVEAEIYEQAINNGDTYLETLYNKIMEGTTTSEKQEALDLFRKELYKNYSEEIFNKMNIEKDSSGNQAILNEDWDKIEGEFNYYLKMWDMINHCGGCQTIDAQYQSGDDGNNWFNNMVKSGQVCLLELDSTTNKWAQTTPATSINSNYLQEVQDESDIKKAEAEYEHELDIIKRKDTKYDLDLSKLETERTTITTEIDAVTKVRDDNVERTFGIFS